MSCFMRYIAAEVASNNAMPCWIVLLIKFFLNVSGYILKKDVNKFISVFNIKGNNLEKQQTYY